MLFLLLAIGASAMVSVVMRLSSGKVRGNVAMLAMNYLMCLCLSAVLALPGGLFPGGENLPGTLGMGAVHGVLYLGSFVLFQWNVKENGVVLSATFMKLGLLVPMVVSVFAFGEMPGLWQWVGFALAVGAIVLVNLEKDSALVSARWALPVLLLAGGTADAMSKVFEELGDANLAPQFLFYTFLVAFVLCCGLTAVKKQRVGKAEIFYGLLIGVPNFFSARFLLGALEALEGVIVYPTYSVATIAVVSLAGVGLFRERLSRRQWTAMAVIAAALVLLNL